MKSEMKRLYRSEDDSLVAGIIGGVGEYFSIDPTVLRLAFVVLVLVTGIFPGVIAYIIAYFIVPSEERVNDSSFTSSERQNNMRRSAPIIPDRPAGSSQSTDNSQQQKTNKDEVIITPPPASNPTPEIKLQDLIEEKKNGATHTEPETKTDIEKIVDQTDETLSQLKKPQWPILDSSKSKVESPKEEEIQSTEIEYPEDIESETPTLDFLLDEDYDRSADLDDVVDE